MPPVGAADVFPSKSEPWAHQGRLRVQFRSILEENRRVLERDDGPVVVKCKVNIQNIHNIKVAKYTKFTNYELWNLYKIPNESLILNFSDVFLNV